MDLELTDSQTRVRDLVRRFAAERLDQAGVETDRTHQYPAEIIKELSELGIMGIFVPETYGGAGMDHVSYALAIEEISVQCAATGVIVSAHSSLAMWPILGLGTEQQKQRFLPAMAAGKHIGCFALTEPQAGSDAAGQKTRAVRDGPQASVAIVFAMTDPTAGHHGISTFIVDTGNPGWQVVHNEDKMGIHGAHSAQLSFSDMRVPADCLLTGEGQGFKVAMKTLDGGRIGIAAQAVGIGRAALEASLKYASERRAFGAPIGSFQAIQWKLADMAVEVDAARMLTLQAAALKDAGKLHTKESAMAKLFAAEAAMKAATEAVQIHGGYGYTKEFKVERFFRDAKITEIYEGTSEIQRLVIAGQVLEER
jgi:butyryl-CoA dehydrogenase